MYVMYLFIYLSGVCVCVWMIKEIKMCFRNIVGFIIKIKSIVNLSISSMLKKQANLIHVHIVGLNVDITSSHAR